MFVKFNTYEKVTIKCLDKNFIHLNNKTGYILSMQQDVNQNCYYLVSVDPDGICVSFHENELESLGTFIKPEDHFSGESIRVGVTKDGKGYIIENKNDSK